MKRSALKRGTKPLSRSASLSRVKPQKRRVQIKRANRKRQAKEHLRAYGPESRSEFVKGLPCLVCGRSPVDQAHVKTGGTGRKADAKWVVPLCSGPEGHHAEHHRGRRTFETKYAISLAVEAERVQRAWEGAKC